MHSSHVGRDTSLRGYTIQQKAVLVSHEPCACVMPYLESHNSVPSDGRLQKHVHRLGAISRAVLGSYTPVYIEPRPVHKILTGVEGRAVELHERLLVDQLVDARAIRLLVLQQEQDKRRSERVPLPQDNKNPKAYVQDVVLRHSHHVLLDALDQRLHHHRAEHRVLTADRIMRNISGEDIHRAPGR